MMLIAANSDDATDRECSHWSSVRVLLPIAVANSPSVIAIAAARVAMLPLRMIQNSAHAQLKAHSGP